MTKVGQERCASSARAHSVSAARAASSLASRLTSPRLPRLRNPRTASSELHAVNAINTTTITTRPATPTMPRTVSARPVQDKAERGVISVGAAAVPPVARSDSSRRGSRNTERGAIAATTPASRGCAAQRGDAPPPAASRASRRYRACSRTELEGGEVLRLDLDARPAAACAGSSGARSGAGTGGSPSTRRCVPSVERKDQIGERHFERRFTARRHPLPAAPADEPDPRHPPLQCVVTAPPEVAPNIWLTAS